MRKIRTLVIDDEPLARARILKLLAQTPYIEVLGECKNGREALKKINSYKPDLAFLDIQMPDLNGFDVLEKEELNHLPFIIFVTAYDQYALKAFDVHAVDYLLKPYDDERFMQALEHAKEQILLKDNAKLHQKMVNILEEYNNLNSEDLNIIEIKDRGGRVNKISVKDIYWIKADGNYLDIHLEHKSYLFRETLQNIESMLNSKFFVRVHRSILLNKNYVTSYKYQGNNQYLITFLNGAKLTSSRSYKDQVLKLLSI
jgi:two-component system LytT family response regulator